MNTDELKRLAEAATPGPWVAKDWASTDSDGAIDVCGVSVMSPKEMCGIFTVSLEGDERNDVDYIAAANPAAILELIAERDALKATFEHTLAECRDAYPVPEVGSELEGLWGQAMGDPESVGAYVKACAASQQKEIDALKAERDELRANEAAWRKLNDTLTHQILCCGVAASHPDATLTTRGAYAGKWNSNQAEAVRALRADRDSLRAELERIKALPPVAEVVMTAKPPKASPAWLPHKIVYASIKWIDENPVGTKLYALGSKHD